MRSLRFAALILAVVALLAIRILLPGVNPIVGDQSTLVYSTEGTVSYGASGDTVSMSGDSASQFWEKAQVSSASVPYSDIGTLVASLLSPDRFFDAGPDAIATQTTTTYISIPATRLLSHDNMDRHPAVLLSDPAGAQWFGFGTAVVLKEELTPSAINKFILVGSSVDNGMTATSNSEVPASNILPMRV